MSDTFFIQRLGDLFEEDKLLHDYEAYPDNYYDSLQAFWGDSGVQRALLRSNEAPIPEK